VDGVYFSTLTNLVPYPGNRLTVTLNGYPITYTVLTNSTLSTVAAGLALLINAATNATLVKALVHGDRIELHSIATNPWLSLSTLPTALRRIPPAFPIASTPCQLLFHPR